MKAATKREQESAEGWILAGGQSRRMGQDKARVRLAGRPLLAHMLDKLRALGLQSRIAGGVPGEDRARLEPTQDPSSEWFPDSRAGCGPMAGLATALAQSASPLILVLGIDLPLVSTALLAALLARARASGALATIPRASGRPQPLCAVYRRELCEAVSRLLADDVLKMMHAVSVAATETAEAPTMSLPVDTFDVETLVATGWPRLSRPVAWEFLNCNTPADLALAARVVSQEAQLRHPDTAIAAVRSIDSEPLFF